MDPGHHFVQMPCLLSNSHDLLFSLQQCSTCSYSSYITKPIVYSFSICTYLNQLKNPYFIIHNSLNNKYKHY